MAGITVTLGGKERELRFSFLSLKSLEQHYGKPVQKVFEEDMAAGGLAQLTVLIWACLRKEKLSLNKVEELIDDAIEDEEITMEELSTALTSALNDSKIIKAQATTQDDEVKN